MTGKILSILNIECETLGMLRPLLLADRYEIEELLATKQDIQIDPNKYEAIIILGGPMSAYDHLEFLELEKLLIRDAVHKHIPILGVCLGSQLIASALGGRVYKGNHKEIGWFDLQLTETGKNEFFYGIGRDRLKVFQWHGDTFELPTNTNILASSEHYVQAFKIGTAIGIQFHIEVTGDMIKRWSLQYDQEIRELRMNHDEISGNLNLNIGNLRKYCQVFYTNFSSFVRQCGRDRKISA
ncbi:MAG: type 1 glutamine amidotransferase [Nitrososphaeraceae archaeon]